MTTKWSGANATKQPRAHHIGINLAEGNFVATATISTSEWYQLFQLPDPFYVISGRISMSVPAGESGNGAIIKLGTSESDDRFGTYTVSGSAALPKTVFWGPYTLSSSGGAASASNPQFWPVTATVLSGNSTATSSLSIYVIMEYVMPGNLNSGIGTSGGGQGL